jgi:hypothetical protein
MMNSPIFESDIYFRFRSIISFCSILNILCALFFSECNLNPQAENHS